MTNTQKMFASIVSAGSFDKEVTIKGSDGDVVLKRGGVRKNDIAVTQYNELVQAVGILEVGQRLHFRGIRLTTPKKRPHVASVAKYLSDAGYAVSKSEGGLVATVGNNVFKVVNINTTQAAKAGRRTFERFIERTA